MKPDHVPGIPKLFKKDTRIPYISSLLPIHFTRIVMMRGRERKEKSKLAEAEERYYGEARET